MKKQTYLKPEITVVTFKVERGFAGTGENPTTLGVFSHSKSDNWDNVTTGDRLSEMTSSDGENINGTWF